MDLPSAPLPVDPTRYTVEDGAGTVRSAVPRWRWVLEGIDELPHGALVALEALVDALRSAGGTGERIDDLVGPVDAALLEVARRAGRRAPLCEALDPSDPLVTAVETVDRMLSAASRHVVAGIGTCPGVGTVVSVHRSAGGVPKVGVDGPVSVGPDGLDGDRQKVRRHHGRPSQALCLWSAEVISALAAEGHPVAPGSTGENLTLSGVDWGALRPGVRLVFGDGDDAPAAEVTGWADPCRTIAGSFLDGRFGRIDHARHPGTSRAYAAVLRPGRLRPGSPVTVLP